MTVADRIKHLREQMGMTQEELAKRMGYTGKSSISKIETSGNNITIKKISRLSPILNTSNAYLMGWTDNPDPNIDDIETGIIMHNKIHDDIKSNMQDVSQAECEEEIDFFSTLSMKERDNITRLYQLYQNASPEVRSAVELLLKAQQQES